jgi:hypothetical protein
MSTLQELNQLLDETQKEVAVWQQLAILMALRAYAAENDGDGMTEDMLEQMLDPIADSLRKFNSLSDSDKAKYTE